ncbi:5-(carboxyamino)imidazole ribonucleotide mutase [Elusimicrobiota bacterium]
MKVVIILGSKSDLEYAGGASGVLDELGIEYIIRIASAHKTPQKVLDILEKYSGTGCVFITVAGMSNALSGFVDANTHHPVIASPPYSGQYSGMDILSSLRMPSGVCPGTVLGAENAALAAAKILALSDEQLGSKIKKYQETVKNKVEEADREVKG